MDIHTVTQWLWMMIAFKYNANDGYIGVIGDTFWDRSCIITGTHLYTKTSSVPPKINRTYDCRLCFRLWQELILLNSIFVTCLPVASRTLRFIPTERTCCCSLVFPNLQCCRTVNAVNSNRDMNWSLTQVGTVKWHGPCFRGSGIVQAKSHPGARYLPLWSIKVLVQHWAVLCSNPCVGSLYTEWCFVWISAWIVIIPKKNWLL